MAWLRCGRGPGPTPSNGWRVSPKRLWQRFSWPGVEPFAEADASAGFERNEAERLAGEAPSLAIVAAAQPERVWGGASMYDVDFDEERAAAGYWLAPEAGGRGAATRTLRLLAGWASGGLGVARLELMCSPDNIPSQRLAERCGFVREGLLRSRIRFRGPRTPSRDPRRQATDE